MPSLRDGIAALIVHAASLDVDAAQQFVVFPNFRLRVDQDSLAFSNPDAALSFAHVMNMIPARAPQFDWTTHLVWDVYKDILNNRVLPAPTAGGQGFAREFIKASAQLGSPEMTVNEVEFYSTSIVPVDLDDPAVWTPVVLGRDAISQLAPQLSADHQAWLARFNLLPQLADEFLEAISLERLTLVVLRPWYNPAVCTWRFWDLPRPLISDGNALPRGRLPGVITKVVLVRNLRLQFAASLLPAVGPSILLRADMALDPVAHLQRLSGAGPTGTRHALRLKDFWQGTGTLTERIEALDTARAREIGARETLAQAAQAGFEGVQEFHVPFRFNTQQAHKHISAALAAASATRAAKEAELGAARTKLQELLQTKVQWQTHPPLVQGHR